MRKTKIIQAPVEDEMAEKGIELLINGKENPTKPFAI
jgi:hypothetical protein